LPGLQVHTGRGEEPSSGTTALVSQPAQETGLSTKPTHAVALAASSDLNNSSPPKVQATLPFGTGKHLIIDQESCWYDEQAISFNAVALVPAIAGREVIVSTLARKEPLSFGVRLQETGSLEVEIWATSKRQSYRSVNSSPKRSIELPVRSHQRWSFRR